MTTTDVVPIEEARDTRRQAALLKAIGLDRVPPEQREIALAIAKRYELDLLLKHLVLVDGRPYITRDGLLHVAHRSGQLDGIEVTDPELVKLEGVGDFWRARASVYRKDMSRPFVYQGRYPAKGGNQRFAPEMAVKVAEVMALRRAFDVSAPVIEERWDMEATIEERPERPLREDVAARRAAITSGRRAASVGPGADSFVTEGDEETPHPAMTSRQGDLPEAGPPAGADARTSTWDAMPSNDEAGTPTSAPSPAGTEAVVPLSPASVPHPAPDEPPPSGADMPPPPATAAASCDAFHAEYGRCRRMPGHKGNHQGATQESWR